MKRDRPHRLRLVALRVRFFFRRYWGDLFAAAVAIATAVAAFEWAAKPSEQLLVSVLIALIATIVIVMLRTRETDFHFEALQRRSEKDQWAGYGTFEYSRVPGCFRITQSDAGFILTKALTWSDYSLSFRFKILSSCLGVIVRAVNLSNLVMLQIVPTGINPHIRVNGIWNVGKSTEAGLDFPTPLNLDLWHECMIQVDKDEVRIRIERDNSVMCDRGWRIPRGMMLFNLQDASAYSDGVYEGPKTIPFAINLEYGTVGFRNDASEEALVREVLLEKLRA